MMKLGICDYGIGGIGLYQKIREKVSTDIVYFSDAGFIPYGKVSEHVLAKRIEKVLDFFTQQGVSKIAVACNSASTVISETENLMGMLSSGIRSVEELNIQKVGVVGGGRTIASNIFIKAFEKKGIHTKQANAQAISIHVEAGDIDSEELKTDLIKIFTPFSDYKHILLACSHYPAVSKHIKKILPFTNLIDPVEKMGEAILDHWDLPKGNYTTTWYTSGNVKQMQLSAERAFNEKIQHIEYIQL